MSGLAAKLSSTELLADTSGGYFYLEQTMKAGLWTVTEKTKYHPEHKQVYCFCECACGRRKWVARFQLRQGKSKSCKNCSLSHWHVVNGKSYTVKMLCSLTGHKRSTMKRRLSLGLDPLNPDRLKRGSIGQRN